MNVQGNPYANGLAHNQLTLFDGIREGVTEFGRKWTSAPLLGKVGLVAAAVGGVALVLGGFGLAGFLLVKTVGFLATVITAPIHFPFLVQLGLIIGGGALMGLGIYVASSQDGQEPELRQPQPEVRPQEEGEQGEVEIFDHVSSSHAVEGEEIVADGA